MAETAKPPAVRRKFPRRRAMFVLTYSCTILSIATISWAILSWSGAGSAMTTSFDLGPRLLFLAAAALTVGLALWGWRYIEENDLYLFREEAGPLMAICALLSLGAIWQGSSLAKTWLGAGGSGFIVPFGMGALVFAYFVFRLARLYDLPARMEMGGEPRKHDPWYSVGLAFLGLVIWVAGFLAADFFGLGDTGRWLPMLVGGMLALVFVLILRNLFRPGLVVTSHVQISTPKESPTIPGQRRLTAATSSYVPAQAPEQEISPRPLRRSQFAQRQRSRPPVATQSLHVLFLCSGNIYRSRFAEAIFNHRAMQNGSPWRAISRGLAVEFVEDDISPHTLDALQRRGIDISATSATRQELTIPDLEAADFIVALNEDEHLPMLRAKFPGWVERIEFWQVRDIDQTRPAQALAMIEALVGELAERLAEERAQAKI